MVPAVGPLRRCHRIGRPAPSVCFPAPPPSRESSELEQSEKDGHLAASRQPFRRVKAERRVNVIDCRRRQRVAGAEEPSAAGANLRPLLTRQCPFVFCQSLLGRSASSSTSSSSSAPNSQFAAWCKFPLFPAPSPRPPATPVSAQDQSQCAGAAELLFLYSYTICIYLFILSCWCLFGSLNFDSPGRIWPLPQVLTCDPAPAS